MLQQLSPERASFSRRHIRLALALLIGIGVIGVLPWRLAAQEIRPDAPRNHRKESRAHVRALTIAPSPAPVEPAVRTRSYYPSGNWDTFPMTVLVPSQPETATSAESIGLMAGTPSIKTMPAQRPNLKVEITTPVTTTVTLPQIDPTALHDVTTAPLQVTTTIPRAHDLTSIITPSATVSLPVQATTDISAGITLGHVQKITSVPTTTRSLRIDTTITPHTVAPRTDSSSDTTTLHNAHAAAQDPSLKRVTLYLRGIDFYEALKKLFEEADVSYRMDEDVAQIAKSGKTTIQMVDVPFRAGLDMLMGSTRTLKTPLTYEVHEGFYVIEAPSAREGSSEAPLVARTDGNNHPIRSIEDVNTARMSLKAEDANLRNVLKLMFEQVGANYTIDPRVGQTESVTVSLKDVPFRTALEAVLRQSRVPLTYTIENNIYHIAPKQQSAAGEAESLVTRTELMRLVQEKTSLEAYYRKGGLTYKPHHPHMVALKQKIDDLNDRIQETRKKLGD